jgi:hypothetical protein
MATEVFRSNFLYSLMQLQRLRRHFGIGICARNLAGPTVSGALLTKSQDLRTKAAQANCEIQASKCKGTVLSVGMAFESLVFRNARDNTEVASA